GVSDKRFTLVCSLNVLGPGWFLPFLEFFLGDALTAWLMIAEGSSDIWIEEPSTDLIPRGLRRGILVIRRDGIFESGVLEAVCTDKIRRITEKRDWRVLIGVKRQRPGGDVLLDDIGGSLLTAAARGERETAAEENAED